MKHIKEILEERYGKQCIAMIAKGKGKKAEQAKEMIKCNKEVDGKVCKHCGASIEE